MPVSLADQRSFVWVLFILLITFGIVSIGMLYYFVVQGGSLQISTFFLSLSLILIGLSILFVMIVLLFTLSHKEMLFTKK